MLFEQTEEGGITGKAARLRRLLRSHARCDQLTRPQQTLGMAIPPHGGPRNGSEDAVDLRNAQVKMLHQHGQGHGIAQVQVDKIHHFE